VEAANAELNNTLKIITTILENFISPSLYLLVKSKTRPRYRAVPVSAQPQDYSRGSDGVTMYAVLWIDYIIQIQQVKFNGAGLAPAPKTYTFSIIR